MENLFISSGIYINAQLGSAFIVISKNNYSLYGKTDFING